MGRRSVSSRRTKKLPGNGRGRVAAGGSADGGAAWDFQTLVFVTSLPVAALLVLQALRFAPRLTSDGTTAAITAVVIMSIVVCCIITTMKRLGYVTSLLNCFSASLRLRLRAI